LTLTVAVAFSALPTQAQKYTRTDLVDQIKDPNLINAWGMSRSSGSPWWISDNGTGLSTLYDGTGVTQNLVVTIPTPDGQGTSAPTGQVYNYTTGFEVAAGKPAIFIFVTEDGTISGWNPQVDGTHSIIKVNRSDIAIYKGVALAQSGNGPRLYATNFKTGQVDVFDSNFNPIPSKNPQLFRIPRLNQDWAPFGIQSVGGNLVVTFAHRLPGQDDEDHGPGLGWVGIFDPQGKLLMTLEHGDFDNAPWGIAMSPGDFGVFSHRLLIGNFGDGTIQAYNAFTGKHEGMLLDANSQPLVIEGLWGLTFGNNAKAGSAIELYFTAGPNDEQDGLFGKLVPVAGDQRGSND
jgi:uncharacterized protein (TIGR03118 family)